MDEENAVFKFKSRIVEYSVLLSRSRFCRGFLCLARSRASRIHVELSASVSEGRCVMRTVEKSEVELSGVNLRDNIVICFSICCLYRRVFLSMFASEF